MTLTLSSGGMTPGSQETSVDLALEQLLLIVPRSFNLVPPWAYSRQFSGKSL